MFTSLQWQDKETLLNTCGLPFTFKTKKSLDPKKLHPFKDVLVILTTVAAHCDCQQHQSQESSPGKRSLTHLPQKSEVTFTQEFPCRWLLFGTIPSTFTGANLPQISSGQCFICISTSGPGSEYQYNASQWRVTSHPFTNSQGVFHYDV